MAGTKTNERPGVRASLSNFGMSASKARVVLNLIRGEDVQTARDILTLTTREAAGVINKVLASAVANAVNNSGYSADELYVAAAYADLDGRAKALGSRLAAPYMTLSFMALLVIPSLKLGPDGLFDVDAFRPTGLFA